MKFLLYPMVAAFLLFGIATGSLLRIALDGKVAVGQELSVRYLTTYSLRQLSDIDI